MTNFNICLFILNIFVQDFDLEWWRKHSSEGFERYTHPLGVFCGSILFNILFIYLPLASTCVSIFDFWINAHKSPMFWPPKNCARKSQYSLICIDDQKHLSKSQWLVGWIKKFLRIFLVQLLILKAKKRKRNPSCAPPKRSMSPGTLFPPDSALEPSGTGDLSLTPFA